MTEAQKLGQKVEQIRGDVKSELAGIRGSIETLSAKVDAMHSRHGDELRILFGQKTGLESRLRDVELTYVRESDFKPLVREVGSIKTQVTKVVAIGAVLLMLFEGALRFFG